MKNNIYREIDENKVLNPHKLDEVMFVIKPSGWITRTIIKKYENGFRKRA